MEEIIHYRAIQEVVLHLSGHDLKTLALGFLGKVAEITLLNIIGD